MAFKIYTKTGDKGETGLFGGERVSKDDLRIEAYGTLDELNSHIGLVRDLTPLNLVQDELLAIQNALFTIGSHLASKSKEKVSLPPLEESWSTALEAAMDKMDKIIPPLKNFILPGGHPTVSQTHIARCVCRRAERRVVSLAKRDEVDGLIIIYLNRLSDYLFVLSRALSFHLEVSEISWIPSK